MSADAKFDVVIGLEVHVQLASQTKIFCGCALQFGAPPNTQVCPVCAGLPGSLPVLNKRVFELGLRAVAALNGETSRRIKFDRKNYFYPDLPKNYQISQYDMPVGKGGWVDIALPEGERRIRLTRAHLEEDAGKLIHEKNASFVDLNRAGTPLLEIVSEPEIKNPDEAYAYLVSLKATMKAIGVSDVNMEKGHLRCDANVSVRKTPQDPFGTKVEIKNLNSFKYVRAALNYEIERQSKCLASGEKIVQETRLWDTAAGRTVSMRSKEQAHDYRYFPDPDLVPFEVDAAWIQKIADTMPELPKEKKEKFKQKFGLNDYDTALLMQDDSLTALFESLSKEYSNYKSLANWITGPLFAYLNEKGIDAAELQLPRAGFIELMKIVDEGVVSLKACREIVFPEFMQTGASPRDIVVKKQLTQVSDKGALADAADRVIAANPKVVGDFKAGKKEALMFLVGQVMRETKGKANPNLVNEILQEKLK